VAETTQELNLTQGEREMFDRFRIPAGILRLAQVEHVTDPQAREKGIKFDGDCAGTLFPYFVAGEYRTCRVRRDHPEHDADGKIQDKYISAFGDKRHLYLPPNYQALLDDPAVPLCFVESEKGVLAITAWSMRVGRKVLPVGTGGCNGWRGKIGIETTANGERVDQKGPLPEVAFVRDGRVCGILFDSNTRSNSKVRAARKALKAQLENQGARVVLIDLPAIEGVNGPDDYLAIAGDAAFADLLDGKAPASSPGDLTTQPLNDYGNGQRLIAVHGQDVRYCPPFKKWLIWDGRRWKLDEANEIRERIHKVMLDFFAQSIKSDDKALIRFASQCLNSHHLSAALREAEPYLAVLPEALDTHPWYLNFLNAMVDLRTGEQLDHEREYLITKLIHHAHNEQAACPRFRKFLERCVGFGLVPFLQKCLGYSLTGITSEKMAFLCLGPTNTGKTTLLALYRDLLDEYATLVMVDALMQKTEDNNSRADLADLRGARFVMTSESEENTRVREGKLKRITQGQGKVKAVRKFENPIEFEEQCKIWIDANHKPLVYGTDDSIWNRLVPIPFEQRLSPSEIDRTLPAKLREEAEGILAWSVEGSRQWFTEGLTVPQEIESTRNAWRMEMDRIGGFRKECCVEGLEDDDPGKPYRVRARQLYTAYKEWTEKAGEHPMTETRFGLRLSEAGIIKQRNKDGIYYTGIALLDWAKPQLAKPTQRNLITEE
jgi:putative DNA primase/helicase